MTSREEYSRIMAELEHAAQELELLILQFRRLERDLWPDVKPPDEPQISPPWTTK